MADPKKPTAPAPVPVVTPSGKVGYLPPEHAQDAGVAGSRRASDGELRAEQLHANEDATAEELRRKFEGVGGAVEGVAGPVLAGAARGLSLGTSDEAILRAAEILGGREGREVVRNRLVDYKEYAPAASVAGELGGVVLGTLAGDELALGGAPGLVSRAGIAAERAVAGGLGRGAAARGAGILTRGAVEGGAFGAGDAISESSLQNHDLTAEALIGGAAHGAMGGVLAAGLVGAAGKVVSGLRAPKATAAAYEGLAGRTYGEAAPGVGRAIADEAAAASEVGATYVDGQGVRRYVASDGVVLEPSAPKTTAYRTAEARAPDVGPADGVASKYIEHVPGSSAEQQALHAEAWANRDRVFTKHAATIEDASRSFSTDLNEALEAGRKVDMASFGEAKVNQMSRLVDRAKFAEQAELARTWMRDADEVIAKIADDPTSGMTREARRQWNAWRQKIEALSGDENAVKFVPHPNARPAEVTVMVNADALDAAWARDQGFYIPRGGGGAEIPGRRAGVETFLESGKPVQASRINLLEDGTAAFTDGRHRFSVLRDGGADRVAVTIPRKELARFGPEFEVSELVKALPPDSVALHTTFDEMKRFLGRQAQFGNGPFGLSRAAREFDGLYQGTNGLKQLLESDVWGEGASKAQREINSATHQMLSEGKLFTRKFTTEFGSDAGRPLYAADTSAVSGFMGRLTSAANDLDARGVESWINARRGYLRSVAQNYEFDAGATLALERERMTLDRLEATYKTATRDVTLSNQVRAALSEERERGMGGAIGAVLDIANKPYTTLQRLAQIESHTKSVIDKLTGDTKKFLGAEGKAANANAGEAGAVTLKPPKASGQGFFAALLDGAGKSAAGVGGVTSRDVFHRRIDEIGKMQGNPSLVASRIGASLEPLGEAAPNVSTAAMGVALRGIDYLAQKLPPSRLDPYSLTPQLQGRGRASDTEISQFMRSVQAVDDPLIVLREAKDGTLTRDHVEAVKAIYPELYDQMREHVMRTLVDAKSELPYAKRIQLGILLDIPTDKTLSPEFQRAIQATYSGADQAGAESPPPNIAPPNIAGSVQTASQQAVARTE